MDGLIGPVTNNRINSDVAKSHVSVATFDGKGSERRSIDNVRSIRSSQINSPTRNNIKNVFRKSNAKESHKPLPVCNSDAQDYLEGSREDIENAFDVADQSPTYARENGRLGQDFTNTQWHDVQIVETEDGN